MRLLPGHLLRQLGEDLCPAFEAAKKPLHAAVWQLDVEDAGQQLTKLAMAQITQRLDRTPEEAAQIIREFSAPEGAHQVDAMLDLLSLVAIAAGNNLESQLFPRA